ncbi:MAG: hypothetical protein HY719_01465 [Planctomycetes bacterium]|nr:hypothetical protein [Planctomycetota bacterium]
MEWQVVAGMESAVRIIENVNAKPNPTVELREILPNGASVKVVWSLLYRSKVAKLVTVHFFYGDS